MENNLFYTDQQNWKKYAGLLLGILVATILGWLIAGNNGMTTGLLLIILPFAIGILALIFLKPRAGFLIFIVYCFLMATLVRHIPGPQFGLGFDALLVLTWLGIIFHRGNKFRFRHLNNDLMWLSLAWLVLTVLQIANPERPSILGWIYEARSATFYWILTVSLSLLILNKKSDIDLFFKIIIFFAFIAVFYGIKQLYIGVDAAENAWLEAGAKKTHVLFGKLRVFSFYSDSAQFGASEAHVSIMCIILAAGPHSVKRKLLYAFAGLVIFYGMLISGTRGALFGLVGGGFTFLILSKQVRILIIGGIIGLGFLGMLKFTHIGSGNDQITRLRTSLDPNDASFQVRLHNQATLRDFLSNKPFGAGVGTLGTWGVKYNADKFISTIPPDSLYVKIWAMYGIVGFIIWFGIMLYILGKSAGIIWNTRDPVLKNKLSALCGGAAGVLLASYGNEVLNSMPTSTIVYVSWAFIWLSPRWDTPLPKTIAA